MRSALAALIMSSRVDIISKYSNPEGPKSILMVLSGVSTIVELDSKKLIFDKNPEAIITAEFF